MNTIITSSVHKAAKFILSHEPVAFPTETVYGLGANVFDEISLEKIFKIKNRPMDNPLIVHISKLHQIQLLAHRIPKNAELLIKKFFPGPLTIVLKKNEIIPDFATANLDTIAIRMPSLKLSRDFIDACGVPIAAPSANLSGKPSPTTWQHVQHDLAGKVSCILKGPKCDIGIESTVIDCTENIPVILRPGIIHYQQIAKVIPKVKIADHSNIIRSPGLKYKHYSPLARVILVDTFKEIPEDLIKEFSQNIAYIGFENFKYKIKKRIIKTNEQYSHFLFDFFRDCDKKNIKLIYCQKVRLEGIGMAIMNRLIKAARN